MQIVWANLPRDAMENEAEIESNLRLLRSSDQQDRATAMTRLKALAQASSVDRLNIIHSLINALGDPRADFDTRRACMNLLGDLKATEAIDVLVKHLTDLQGITGLSETWYPAVKALHKIGPPAIPALSKALSDPDPKTRKYAAEALILIDGKAAQERLEQALKTEQDSEVLSTIESGLCYLQNNARRQKRSGNH